ncbi:MAG: hypothetical protein EPN74_06920 [Rhodanobacter sp.]|nr:MAG: hypothetical protein EPN74_06920 [Rhodanobacter sp.]
MTPASLSARITMLLVITSLLVLGGGAKLMDWRIDHEMEGRFQQNLLTQAIAVSSMAQLEQDESPGDPGSQPRAGLLGGSSPTYHALRCDGEPPRFSTPPPPAVPADWFDHVGPKPHFARLRHGEQHLGSVQFSFIPDPVDNGETTPTRDASDNSAPRQCALLFEQDRKAIDQILLATDWTLLLGPALALAIALLAVPLIVRRGLRPVGVLVERMRDIGPNAPGQRLAALGMRELDPLVGRFNDVLGRMDEGLARERQFASGLAHETRTRLAELRALTEIEARYPSGRSMSDILGEIGLIGAELEATVTALLLLTRLKSGLERPQRQSLELLPWLQRQLQRQQPLAGERGIELHTEGTPPVNLHTDPALLEVIMANLLGNACAYAPGGDRVVVRLSREATVIDNAAPELEPSDLDNFGERFWRKQPPHAGHAGLGLALAHAAAQALAVQLDFTLKDGRLLARLAW